MLMGFTEPSAAPRGRRRVQNNSGSVESSDNPLSHPSFGSTPRRAPPSAGRKSTPSRHDITASPVSSRKYDIQTSSSVDQSGPEGGVERTMSRGRTPAGAELSTKTIRPPSASGTSRRTISRVSGASSALGSARLRNPTTGSFSVSNDIAYGAGGPDASFETSAIDRPPSATGSISSRSATSRSSITTARSILMSSRGSSVGGSRLDDAVSEVNSTRNTMDTARSIDSFRSARTTGRRTGRTTGRRSARSYREEEGEEEEWWTREAEIRRAQDQPDGNFFTDSGTRIRESLRKVIAHDKIKSSVPPGSRGSSRMHAGIGEGGYRVGVAPTRFSASPDYKETFSTFKNAGHRDDKEYRKGYGAADAMASHRAKETVKKSLGITHKRAVRAGIAARAEAANQRESDRDTATLAAHRAVQQRYAEALKKEDVRAHRRLGQ